MNNAEKFTKTIHGLARMMVEHLQLRGLLRTKGPIDDEDLVWLFTGMMAGELAGLFDEESPNENDPE